MISLSKTHNKRKKPNHTTIVLLALVLGLSTTTAAVAGFVNDRSSVQQVFDLLGGATGKKDADPVDQALDGIDTVDETVDTVSDALRQAEEFYRRITNNNISGAISQIEAILGELGILDPSKYPGEIGEIVTEPGGTTKGTVPTGTPITPERIYEQQQMVTDTANSDGLWIHTDSVLGNGLGEGQERLAATKQLSTASAAAAKSSYGRSSSESQQTYQNAELAQNASTAAEKLSQQAQGRTASQDILKDLASQQSEVGKANAAISRQLATLSNQSAIAAGQTAALATQSQVANEHLQELRVGQAMGNLQLHDIFNAQRHANQMQVLEQQKTAQLAVGSTDAIYIPGLFATQSSPN